MGKLNLNQIEKIEQWIYQNARPIEAAKWNRLFNKGSKEDIVAEMLKFQNEDGGFGKGFESDILLPLSAAIPSAEAIFTAYDYELDCSADWFKRLLQYFESTIQTTPSFWECVPKELEDYPHAPWWNYQPDTKFSPNPCAVVASAFILYGSERQKKIGYEIAARCIDFLNSEDFCADHDCYCLQRLFTTLQRINAPLIDEKTVKSMERRISSCVCFDENRWMEYVAQPLDLVNTPESQWYKLVEKGIEKNLSFWINNLNEEGVWMPNFSWGVDSEVSRSATRNWIGYITVKRVKIITAFDLAHND